jgi:2-dehydropantoate 2-reductase
MINVGINQAAAVMRAPFGIFQNAQDAQELMDALTREVIALAEVQGINLTDRDMDEWHTLLNTLSPQGKPSMLQDIEAGRKTEVEMFSGKVVKLGKKYAVPTPVNQTVLRIIRVLEQNPN